MSSHPFIYRLQQGQKELWFLSSHLVHTEHNCIQYNTTVYSTLFIMGIKEK